jgi:hypothetical protein
MSTYLAHRPGVELRDPLAGLAIPAFLRGGERAACADHPAEWWFPNSEASNWQLAARICDHCPLLHGCREWGIEHLEAGVWGGLTEQRRTRIRHEREAAT